MRHLFFLFILLLCNSIIAQQVYLGIYVNEITPNDLRTLGLSNGIVIESVMPGSPADVYGLKDNDIIYKINSVIIRQENDLTKFLSTCEPTDQISVFVYQDRKHVIKQVNLVERDHLHKDLYIFNYIHNPWLFIGINVEAISELLANVLALERGMVITEVRENSLAAFQGLEAGDIIISVNGLITYNERTLTESMNKALQNQPIRFTIWRDSKNIDIDIDLGNALNEHNNNSNEVFIVGPDIFDSELYSYSRDKIDRLLKKSKTEIESDIERLENEIYKLRQRMNGE